MVISSAHISTYGERVVDVFYVKDVFGLKITQAPKTSSGSARADCRARRRRAGRLDRQGAEAVAAEPAAVAAVAVRRPSRLLHSVATVGSMTLMSRGLGFVRDVLVADVLGAGPLADAFFVAFKLPNFLRRLFAEGAFNAGFVPMFARTLEADGPTVAKAFAEQAQAVLVGVLVPLVLLAIPAMPWLITIFTPGFEPPDPRYGAAVELSRITFCYILFISLVALQGGVLNSMNLFGAAAASPIVLNLTMIGGARACRRSGSAPRPTPWPGASRPRGCCSSSGCASRSTGPG